MVKNSLWRLARFVGVLSAAIALLIILGILAFTIFERNREQEQLAIMEVCQQLDNAIARKDYGAAYELMSPSYRQMHSLEEFKDEVRYKRCTEPGKRPVAHYFLGREASIVNHPYGSLMTMIVLEKVNGRWYFTGETHTGHALR